MAAFLRNEPATPSPFIPDVIIVRLIKYSQGFALRLTQNHRHIFLLPPSVKFTPEGTRRTRFGISTEPRKHHRTRISISITAGGDL